MRRRRDGSGRVRYHSAQVDIRRRVTTTCQLILSVFPCCLILFYNVLLVRLDWGIEIYCVISLTFLRNKNVISTELSFYSNEGSTKFRE